MTITSKATIQSLHFTNRLQHCWMERSQMSAACLWWLVSWWPADSVLGLLRADCSVPLYTTIHCHCHCARLLLSFRRITGHWTGHSQQEWKSYHNSNFCHLLPAACLLLTEKWIIMTDIRQQRQVLRKCGGGSLRGSVRKESKGMETRKSETHAACCNNMQYIT